MSKQDDYVYYCFGAMLATLQMIHDRLSASNSRNTLVSVTSGIESLFNTMRESAIADEITKESPLHPDFLK